jgi:hypothetical protein
MPGRYPAATLQPLTATYAIGAAPVFSILTVGAGISAKAGNSHASFAHRSGALFVPFTTRANAARPTSESTRALV